MLVKHIDRSWIELEYSDEEFRQLLGITNPTGRIIQVIVTGATVTVIARDDR